MLSSETVSDRKSLKIKAMKFTTLVPTTWNDGTPIAPTILDRAINALWRPFQAMSNEGYVTGRWIDDDTEFADVCLKVSIECDRSRLGDAIKKAVRRMGVKLRQRAMYFEVAGYDGVQILRIE
jgi:hypothetical protein